MVSPTWWTWVWVNSGSWQWTGRPGMLQSMESQRVRHDWAIKLNWTELNWTKLFFSTKSCLTLCHHGLQHTRLPCPLLSPRVCSNSCPLSQWCHPIISSSATPFSSCLQSFHLSGSSLMSQHFASGVQSIKASLQHQSFQWIFRIDFLKDWLFWSPYSPRDSQQSSPTPKLESINSSALSLFNGPTLNICWQLLHDYCKECSFHYMDLCWQSDISVL